MQLALAALLMSSTPCMRPELMPAELPLMGCPVRATAARCTAGCPRNGQYVDLYYDRGDPRMLAVAWRKLLDADGWRTRTTKISLDPDRPGEPRRPAIGVFATKGSARVSTVVMAAPSDEAVLRLTFTPASRLGEGSKIASW